MPIMKITKIMEESKKQKIVDTVLKEKMPLEGLAKKLFMTERHLKLLLESWGVELGKKRKYNRVPRPDRQSLLLEYRKLGSTQKVAEHYEVGVNVVIKWMRELSIPMRKMKMGKEEKLKYLEEHLRQLENVNL